MKPKIYYQVRVSDAMDPRNGHDTLEWLDERRKRVGLDFEIDMHGGTLGYTSFYFTNRILAIITKLTWS